MVIIHSPMTCIPERDYIYNLIFEQFLGIEFSVIFEQRRSDLEISFSEAGGHEKLLIADVFLQMNESEWLQESTLPKSPLDQYEHAGRSIPIIYGSKNTNQLYYEHSVSTVYCGIDIFGSAMFMLSRYEECVISERDLLDRFSAYNSLAFRENFLHRPIINEYIEILWDSILVLWPRARRVQKKPRQLISHDVDWPFYVVGKTRSNICKEIVSDVIRRQDIQLGYKKAKGFIQTRGGDLTRDPFNTFKWIMDLSERAGIQSAFYFITEETERGLDGNYKLEDKAIQQLLCEIHVRGHEIGLHPSYHTYLNPDRIKHQFDTLLRITEANGIYQKEWGGRQHYLRWRAPDTWQHWEDAGLHYDSTLGYADLTGFRCGICYEFNVYNLKTRKPLKLKERPLIIMEQTILHEEYMGLKDDQALGVINQHYNICKRYNGDFTLLWHNSQLVKKDDVSLYQRFMTK